MNSLRLKVWLLDGLRKERPLIKKLNQLKKKETNNMEFIHAVETAQDDMIKSWENTGIIADAEKLGDDIEGQFKAWEKNMARRAPVQSFTAQESKAVSKNLRS